MCIAVYKPQGINMPSKKILSNCFGNNSHGAGFMFPYNGKVHYEKGFMTFGAFKKGLKNAIKKYGLSKVDTPMVFHFRITSQAGVKDFLTHPFPLTRDFEKMRELKGDCDVACAHNGIIDFASSYSATDYSDTMEFIKEVLYPLVHNNTKYYENKSLMKLLNYLLKGNRFVIMDGKEHVELLGDWKEDKGVFYSNTSYEHAPFSFKKTEGFKKFTPIKSYPSIFSRREKISAKQEKEFLETGRITCDFCGEEMFIKYDNEAYEVIAVCFDCGEELALTLAAEDYAWNHDLVYIDAEDYSDDGYDDYDYGYGHNYKPYGGY